MQLRDAINLAASVVPRNTTLPALSCLALRADGRSITAIGSSIELGIEVTAALDSQAFEVCVDADKLKQAITAMPEATITVADGKMLVRQGRSRATIPVMPYEQHPGMPDTSKATTGIEADIWSLVEKVAFAAGKNDVRFFLNGVSVESDGTQLVAAASDGHRMAIARREVELPVFSIIVPIKNIKTLLSIRPESFAVGNCIVGTRKDVRIYSKLIEGKFPDWRRLMVKHERELQADTKALRDALKTVKPFSHAQYLGARLTWTNKALTIKTANAEQAESQVEIDAMADSDGEIGVNIVYLEEALATIKGEDTAIQYADANTSLRIDDDGLTHIVMPMRL